MVARLIQGLPESALTRVGDFGNCKAIGNS